MKRILALLLIVSLSLMAAPSLAEEAPTGEKITLAARPFNLAIFEKYGSYVINPETGDFSAYANEVTPALKLMGEDAGKYSGGLIYFYIEVTGNKNTGMVTPVLNLIYYGKDARSATAVSFLVGDTRYDFAASAADEELNGRSVQRIRIPLDSDGLGMLSEIAESGGVSVRLHGNEQYSTNISVSDDYDDTRRQIEGMSVAGLGAMLSELNDIGMADYALWDLNGARWEYLCGAPPSMSSAKVGSELRETSGITLDERYNLLSPGDKGGSVSRIKEKLIELNYLTGKPGDKYDPELRNAVRAIQRYMGLIATGSVDRALAETIMNGDIEAAALESETAREDLKRLGPADLAIDRYWYARSVPTSKSDGSLIRRAAANLDNQLIVFDGYIQNNAQQQLDITWQMSGEVIYGGEYSYACTLVVERDGGSGFGDSLIPLAASRLVVYAEIPAELAAPGESWTLKLKVGDETLEYKLN